MHLLIPFQFLYFNFIILFILEIPLAQCLIISVFFFFLVVFIIAHKHYTHNNIIVIPLHLMVKFWLSIKFYHVRYQRITILLDVGKETPTISTLIFNQKIDKYKSSLVSSDY